MIPRKIKKFSRLPRRDKALLLEVFIFLLRARLTLFFFPFRRIAPGLGDHMKETPKESQPEHLDTLRRIRDAITRGGRIFAKNKGCLTKSIAGKYMLKRRNIPYTLYLGVIKGSNTIEQNDHNIKLNAHAWLRSGDMILTGQEGIKLSAYSVVSTFASK